jgi:hypothetical protein
LGHCFCASETVTWQSARTNQKKFKVTTGFVSESLYRKGFVLGEGGEGGRWRKREKMRKGERINIVVLDFPANETAGFFMAFSFLLSLKVCMHSSTFPQYLELSLGIANSG